MLLTVDKVKDALEPHGYDVKIGSSVKGDVIWIHKQGQIHLSITLGLTWAEFETRLHNKINDPEYALKKRRCANMYLIYKLLKVYFRCERIKAIL
jgi:hypothetical protein